MPRPRRRALGLLTGAVLLFFLGTNVQAGWLFVLSACLVGAMLAGLVLPRRMLRGLAVRRRAPQEVHQLDVVPVQLQLTNNARGMRSGVIAADAAFDEIRVSVPAIAPRERVEITTERRAGRRGPDGLGPVALRSSAPFGVGEGWRSVAVEDPVATLVLPAVIRLGPLSFVRPAASSDHAIRTEPRRGHGPEYLGIREYRAGDSMRHVHWPSTARTGLIMVREFEQEQTRRLAIVVDTSWDSGEAWTPLDRVCAAAASVAMAALSQGHGTRLLIPGGDGLEVLGRADGVDLLRRLAHVRADPAVSFASTVSSLAPDLRGVEAAVLVFPARRSTRPGELAAAAAELAGGLDHLVAIPIEVTAEESGAEALPPGMWTELEERLRSAGAEVYPWRDGDDLAAVLSPESFHGIEDVVGMSR